MRLLIQNIALYLSFALHSYLQVTMALDLPRCHLTSTGGMRLPRRRWLPERHWRHLWQRGCPLTKHC